MKGFLRERPVLGDPQTQMGIREEPTIVMVEDEKDTADLIKLLLEREAYNVLHVVDVPDAQSLISWLPPPSLVLLDIMLPKGSGLQLLSFIRKNSGWKDVPIIILTAINTEKDIRQAVAEGANDYIIKPRNPRLLNQLLTKRLQQFCTGLG